jgi:hypothetical protein
MGIRKQARKHNLHCAIHNLSVMHLFTPSLSLILDSQTEFGVLVAVAGTALELVDR